MKEIIHVGTTGIGHSFATTLLSQHNPDIIVVDEVHHINKDITEQLINPNKMNKRITPILVSREELLLQSFKSQTVENHKRLNIYCRTDTNNIVHNNIYTKSK